MNFWEELNPVPCLQETVEERMLEVQARKQMLVNGALSEGALKNARLEQLKMLFS